MRDYNFLGIENKKEVKKAGFVSELLEELKLSEKANRIWVDYGKQIKRVAILAMLVIVVFFGFALKNGDGGAEAANTSELANVAAEEERKFNIFVDIGGEVMTPMLAELPEGSRVEDAIQAAGGLTEKADLTSINRAEFLQDGQKIYIPVKPESVANAGSGADESAANIKGASGSAAEGNGVNGTLAGASGGAVGIVNGKVNINLADSAGLQTLNGIGPATAQKIIDYRNSNGSFLKIEDLKKVSGIGEKTFEKLREHICV